MPLLCTGCKHLVSSYCSAQDGPYEWVSNVYTSGGSYRSLSKHGGCRPTYKFMRTKGDCGEERLLYEPTWLRRLITKITSVFAG